MSKQNNPEQVEDLTLLKAQKELSGEGQWNLIQEVLQEIVAAYMVKDPESTPSSTKLRDDLVNEIGKRYENNKHLQLFLDAIPSDRSIRTWLKKDGWEQAVWDKIKADGLFSNANRSLVIEALRQRAIMKSDTAAKLWLTMSGDYQEKMDISSDKSFDKYRELNEIIHKKKNSE